MIANSASATEPTTATRSASCGVSGRAVLGRLDHNDGRVGRRLTGPIRCDGLCSGLSPPVV